MYEINKLEYFTDTEKIFILLVSCFKLNAQTSKKIYKYQEYGQGGSGYQFIRIDDRTMEFDLPFCSYYSTERSKKMEKRLYHLYNAMCVVDNSKQRLPCNCSGADPDCYVEKLRQNHKPLIEFHKYNYYLDADYDEFDELLAKRICRILKNRQIKIFVRSY